MKILHVIRGLANSSGTTHIVRHLCEEQARLGHRITVMHVDKRRGTPVVPDPALVENQCFPMSAPGNNLVLSVSFAREITRRIQQFDVVHIHAIWNFPTYWTMRQARRFEIPYVVSPQGSLEPWALRLNGGRKATYARLFEAPLFAHASAFQALSEAEVRQIRDYGIAVPSVIIPNGIEPSMFDCSVDRESVRRNWGLAAEDKALLFLARIHPKKGLDLLAEAFGRVAGRLPHVRLIIAGDDAGSGYRSEVEQMLRNRQISERVLFLGEVRGAAKIDALKSADVYILPSYSEGLPVSVLEAMGAGLPVIITHPCNLMEVKHEKAGLVVDPDAAQLADAILKLMGDNSLLSHFSAKGRDLIQTRFNWSSIASQTINLYQALHRPSAIFSAGETEVAVK